MMTWWMIVAALGSVSVQQERAQQDRAAMPAMAEVACPATPAPLPADYAGWATMTPLAASAGSAGATMLPLGSGAAVTLLPATSVTYAAAMKHPGTPGSFGGNLAFTAARAGRYRVALGSGAWIDVVQGGMARASVAHGHGPACSGVRKVVEFDLAPGTYVLQIAGNAAATLGVMVATLSG